MLKLATWNIDGLEPAHLDLRSEAAVFALLSQAPDVMLLQEVVRRSFHAHLRPHLIATGYTLLPPTPQADSEYFCAIASRLAVIEWWRRPFPGSQMGRALLGARLSAPLAGAAPLLVMTAHLESLRRSKPERRRQLALALDTAIAHPGPAIFAGDTNLRDAELDEVSQLDQVDDAWLSCGAPAASRHTWTPRGKSAPGFRFDRAFLSRWPGWRAAGVARFGTDPVEGTDGLRPSDHLGLMIDLKLRSL